jgi:hypothetical protein
VAAALGVMLSAMAAEPVVAGRARWLLLVGPTAILLTGFWLAPFYLREPFFNDMGWERLEDVGPALLTGPIKIALPVAVIGFLVSVATRVRVGVIFAGTGLLFLSAVANLGEGPLWNARLLPFYYLSVYMVAAVGVAMVVRWLASFLADEFHRPERWYVVAATAAATVAVLVAVSMPLRIMPLGRVSASGDGSYRWLAFTNQARSLVPSWADWNYSGYEEKPSYGEYRHVVTTMATVGEERGCGRAMWEYEKGLDRYGTPMALMLLPHWTDGCIGSMEGLYFESSATTPFHFLNQSILSESPSRAQRDLPYQGFDIATGVAQLQVMGVRYYLAQTDSAIAAARQQPDLTEVADAQPFVVFEVAGSGLVQGLAVEPVVAEGRSAEEVAGPAGDPESLSRFDVGWLSQAVTYYNDPASFPAMPAEDGPPGWVRQELLSPGAGTAVEPARVSDITVGDDSVGFSVDRTGLPVLVKVSYFPNWEVEGAEGPWRVGPNLMVVVPTADRVEMTYGQTAVDLGGQLLSLIGLAGLVALGLIDRGRLVPRYERLVAGWRRDPYLDDIDADDHLVAFDGPDPRDRPAAVDWRGPVGPDTAADGPDRTGAPSPAPAPDWPPEPDRRGSEDADRPAAADGRSGPDGDQDPAPAAPSTSDGAAPDPLASGREVER